MNAGPSIIRRDIRPIMAGAGRVIVNFSLDRVKSTNSEILSSYLYLSGEDDSYRTRTVKSHSQIEIKYVIQILVFSLSHFSGE
jgi:hypothetical protein